MVEIDRAQEDDLLDELTPDDEQRQEDILRTKPGDVRSQGSADLNPTHTVGPNPPDEAEQFPNRLDNEISGRP
jgi:hypothetical protein